MSTTIEEIPADELVVMTEFLHRAFNAAGCNPMCHCCKKMIPVGDQFKLGTVEIQESKMVTGNIHAYGTYQPEGETYSKEVMLCDVCTPEAFRFYQNEMLEKNRQEYERLERLHQERGGGCFRINGKIIH